MSNRKGGAKGGAKGGGGAGKKGGDAGKGGTGGKAGEPNPLSTFVTDDSDDDSNTVDNAAESSHVSNERQVVSEQGKYNAHRNWHHISSTVKKTTHKAQVGFQTLPAISKQRTASRF